MSITNKLNVSLPLAVWLLHDEYDYVNDPNYISATSLLKPIKQLILSKRVPKKLKTADVSDFVSSRLGTAIHDSMERVWTDEEARNTSLAKLGIPESVFERIVVNPTDEFIKANPKAIPIYLEQRVKKEIDGFIIGGKFDMIAEGKLFDNKSTSVYTKIMGSKDSDYSNQGSIYRWLNPDKITDPNLYIQFIFTDWQKSNVERISDYPESRVMEHVVPLRTVEDTEEFIRNKLNQYKQYIDSDEADIPECTDEELWRSPPKFKYYSNPEKTTGRASKNFDDIASANLHMAEQGKGIVIPVYGEAKACNYCPAAKICQQRKKYL